MLLNSLVLGQDLDQPPFAGGLAEMGRKGPCSKSGCRLPVGKDHSVQPCLVLFETSV